MKNTFLSRFTPSSMTAETLEAIFVQRHELVKDLIEVIRESALTKNKHFRLLVGGRGMGKTHTISLIYHRLSAMDDLKDKLVIAWMREEEWGIASFLDLLLRIFRALEQEYPEEYNARLEQEIQLLYQMSVDVAEHKAGKLLREFVGDRTLLLLMENLDDTFSGLGDIGQKQFRAYIQNYSFITILATSQRLFNGVKQKDAAFYGFFYPQDLEQLEFDEVVDLLERIARVQGDKDLESFIQSPTGRDRIKAIHHLAGGNHRVYIIFAEFLTRKSLDKLVEPFMQTLDELTPYYQDRMKSLSPQQRKIVDFLCDRRHPVTVKEIANYCFITHQTASSQLKDLREKGYVKVEAIGRESFYDLQEVLMRYCLDVKKQRGKPISLFIDFLRCWYTKDELKEKLSILNEKFHAVSFNLSDPNLISHIGHSYVLEREYISLALQKKEEKKRDPRITAYFQEGNTLYESGKYEEAVASYDRVLEINPEVDSAWINRGSALGKLGRLEETLASCDRALKINPEVDLAWINRGITLGELGRLEEALASCDRAVEINPENDSAWINRGITLGKLGRLEDAVASYDRTLKINFENDSAWYSRGNAVYKLGRLEDAVASYDRALKINLENDSAWINRGSALYKLGKYEETVASCDRAVEINPENDLIWTIRSWVLVKLERYSEALESCDRAFQINKEDSSIVFHRTIALLALNRWVEGIISLEDALNLLPDGEKPSSEDIEIIICNLFDQKQDRDLWEGRIGALLEIFDRYKVTAVLAQAIVKTIPTLMSEMTADKAAQTWQEIWQELTGDRPEFEIPLRLLNTAVRYKQTKGDRKVLLELAVEERNLLEPLVTLQN